MSKRREEVVAKFGALRDQMQGTLIERDDEIECVLLGMISRKHVLFVGDPGTGKSTLCSTLGDGVENAETFEILLTKFTEPSEVFGPINIEAFKSGSYERKVDGKLPTAHFAFMDEIWKASSAINNSMLTAMNERKFDNGGKRIDIPLRLVIAASNEWPIGDGFQESGAAFDRFLIRKHVRPVSRGRRHALIFGSLSKVTKCITLDDIDYASGFTVGMPFSQAAEDALMKILDELAAEGIHPGDRRCRHSASVAQAAAFLDGDEEVQPEHLECLRHVLWNDPQEQASKAAEIVCRIANPVGAKVNSLLAEAEELLGKVNADNLTEPDTLASIQKAKECFDKLSKLEGERAAKAAKYVQEKVSEMHRKILGV